MEYGPVFFLAHVGYFGIGMCVSKMIKDALCSKN